MSRSASLLAAVFLVCVAFSPAYVSFGQECCATPTTETAQRVGQTDTYITDWMMTVSDTTLDTFYTRQIFEYPAQDGADTCYFGVGDRYAPSTTVTGGIWQVTPTNQWGTDLNGFFSATVQYYRSFYGPGINCGSTFYQGLQISCENNWEGYGGFGNVLIMTIYANSEVNYRGEFSGQQIWAQEPQGNVTQM